MGALDARQAALLLHGLPAAKQRSVMARLSRAEAARLKPLLAELQLMGLPRSLGTSLRDPVTPPPFEEPHPPTLERRVANLNAEDVAATLQSCAPGTVALLLRAANWPWKARMLGLLTDSHRIKALSCMQRISRRPAPALLRVLCMRLCEEADRYAERRLQFEAARNQSSAMRTPVASPLQRFKAWMR